MVPSTAEVVATTNPEVSCRHCHNSHGHEREGSHLAQLVGEEMLSRVKELSKGRSSVSLEDSAGLLVASANGAGIACAH